MSYPLIIFGAGASFDSQHLETYEGTEKWQALTQWRPPLTNKLFDIGKFHSILESHKEMEKLVSLITAKLRTTNPKTFEEILTKLYFENIKSDPELYKSFMALLFYISKLFYTISQNYYNPFNNNYGSLIKLISLYGGNALIVNFNYDLLFEKTVSKGSDGQEIDEYIKGNYPVIKVHGACNWYWRRVVDTFGEENKNNYDRSIDSSENLLNTKENNSKMELLINSPKRVSRVNTAYSTYIYAHHPALALPLQNKNHFVCPQSHIDFLKRKIKDIDRIIVIGWKVGDPFIKNLLIDELKSRYIPIAFIGGKNSKNLISNLEIEIQNNITLVDGEGFSNFVGSDGAEDFLSK